MKAVELFNFFARMYVLLLLRYVMFAGIAFFIFYVWKREKFLRLKIQTRFPDSANIRRELLYSLLSLSIFALVGLMVFVLRKAGYTKMYWDFHAHSGWYFVFSVLVFVALHDTYFYWAHRLMHWDRIYKYVHRIHHLSTNPTPWAAFCFHPIEAMMEVAILPIMVFLMPVHPLAIFAWVMYMTLMNVIGHLGFEIFPRGFTTATLSRWHNTSVHHNMHHRFVRCNYGLYFNIWDNIMGTNHAHYSDEFEKVKNSSLDKAI